MHISIKSETLFYIGNFAVTNTLFTSWLVVLGLVIVAFVINRIIKPQPGKFQSLLELIYEKLSGFLEVFAGDKQTVRKFFPLVATIFFFILVSNWVGTLPGVETIGLHKAEETHVVEENLHENEVVDHEVAQDITHEEDRVSEEAHSEGKFIPLLRTVNSDLNVTLALALILVVTTHVVGLKSIGASHHLGKFFVNPFKSPINAFVGILELIGELSRLVSLTFRLFGNIFAGSVLMLIISFLAPYIVPIPFLGLELFVGFIQALVFSVLAMLFLTSSTKMHAEEH